MTYTAGMIIVLFLVSVFGGFCSGLLGVGGAVVLIPLLLTVPPLFGVGELSMHAVAGITMIQVLAASATGACLHRRCGCSHLPTILAFGIPMGLLSFTGAAVSKGLPALALEIAFGCIVAIALVLLLKPSPGERSDDLSFTFNRTASSLAGGAVGFVSGMVGAGGGFILVPVMTSLLKIPMKVAVGSSLGIMFIGSAMGAMGKIFTLQVEWVCLLPVIAGSLPASLAGSLVSRRLPAYRLRYILLGLIVLIFIKTWHRILL